MRTLVDRFCTAVGRFFTAVQCLQTARRVCVQVGWVDAGGTLTAEELAEVQSSIYGAVRRPLPRNSQSGGACVCSSKAVNFLVGSV